MNRHLFEGPFCVITAESDPIWPLFETCLEQLRHRTVVPDRAPEVDSRVEKSNQTPKNITAKIMQMMFKPLWYSNRMDL